MKGLKNPKHLKIFLVLLSIGLFLYFFPGAIPILFGLAIYFLPSIVGWGKKNWAAIFTLNFLLGWTFIGWVVALVWATCKD